MHAALLSHLFFLASLPRRNTARTVVWISLEAWLRERNDRSESEIFRVEADHAAQCGLPALAAIIDALDQVQRSHGRISAAEVEALLRPVLSIARGEAQERLSRATGIATLDVPGVVTVPHRILERDLEQP